MRKAKGAAAKPAAKPAAKSKGKAAKSAAKPAAEKVPAEEAVAKANVKSAAKAKAKPPAAMASAKGKGKGKGRGKPSTAKSEPVAAAGMQGKRTFQRWWTLSQLSRSSSKSIRLRSWQAASACELIFCLAWSFAWNSFAILIYTEMHRIEISKQSNEFPFEWKIRPSETTSAVYLADSRCIKTIFVILKYNNA